MLHWLSNRITVSYTKLRVVLHCESLEPIYALFFFPAQLKILLVVCSCTVQIFFRCDFDRVSVVLFMFFAFSLDLPISFIGYIAWRNEIALVPNALSFRKASILFNVLRVGYILQLLFLHVRINPKLEAVFSTLYQLFLFCLTTF